jgi:hypothetical protein
MTAAFGQSEEELKDFIISMWDMLASYAWKKFIEHGRGMVTLDARVKAPPVQGAIPCGVSYTPANSKVIVEGGGYGNPHWDGMVERYVPDSQMVIGAIYEDGRVTAARVGTPKGFKTPRELADSGYKPPTLTPEMLGMGRN